MNININNMRRPRPCRDITRDVDISPFAGSPEYDEWKIGSDKRWAELKEIDDKNAARKQAIKDAEAKEAKADKEAKEAKADKEAKEAKADKEAKEAKEAKEVVDTDTKK